jgi:TIR domain-containing protein
MGRGSFQPLFEHYLGEDLGQKARVFIDSRLESGMQWPEKLAIAHARSAVLVPLWSKTYFNSPWCRTELALMYAREKHCGYRTPACSDVLILPATIHDGEDFPMHARGVEWLRLNDYANVRLNKQGPSAEAMAQVIRAWTPIVAAAIQRAPGYDQRWIELSIEEFLALFEAGPAKQVLVPVFA